MRADSGFYTHDVVAVCRKTKVRFSITVRLHQHNIIEATRGGLEPIPYCGRRRRCGRARTVSPTPRRCGSSYAG